MCMKLKLVYHTYVTNGTEIDFSCVFGDPCFPKAVVFRSPRIDDLVPNSGENGLEEVVNEIPWPYQLKLGTFFDLSCLNLFRSVSPESADHNQS